MDNTQDTDLPARLTDEGRKRQLLRQVRKRMVAATSNEMNAAFEEVFDNTELLTDVAAAESLAREVLLAAGLPDHLGPFAHYRDGSLKPLQAGWQEAGITALGPGLVGVGILKAILDAREAALAEAPGPSWEAARKAAWNARAAWILWRAERVREALADGCTPNAAWHAMRLGREALLLDLELKGWPAAAEAGDAVKRGGKKGGVATRERNPDRAALRRQVEAEARQRFADGYQLGKSELARHLAAKHGLCANTVRDWLKGVPDPARNQHKNSGG